MDSERGGVGKPPLPEDENTRGRHAVTWAIAGLSITPVTFFFAMMDAMNYHASNHYTFLKCIYPVPALLTNVTGGSITIISIFAALVQFPIYGFIIGIFKQKLFTASMLLFLHVMAVMMAYTFPGGFF